MEINKKAFRNLFLGVGACIVLYWMLHEEERVSAIWKTITGIRAPFVLGAGLAFILNVPMRSFEGMFSWVKNLSLRRVIALLLTLIAFALVLALVFWLLIPQVAATVQSLIPQMVDFFQNAQTWVFDFLENNPQLWELVQNNSNFQNFDWGKLIEKAMSVVSSSLTTIANGAFSAIGSIFGAVVNTVIGIVFAVYCLFRKEILARQGRRLLYALLPEKISDEAVRIFRLTNSTFSNFLSGQCIEVLILGCMFAISMAIFRMPYIPLVSVLVAVTAFIPVVGAFVGCIFGAFFILVDNPLQAVWFIVMFLVLQQIEGNLIYPKVVGDSIGLPGMWVLVAVTVGGELFGVAGMFLMIPLVSVVYTLLGEYTHKRLDYRQIDPDKLTDHPPVLKSGFKENRKKKKAKKKSKETVKEDTKE